MLLHRKNQETDRRQGGLRASAPLYLLILFLVAGLSPVSAQRGQEGLAQRVERAGQLISDGRLVEARPLLISIRDEVEGAARGRIEFYVALSYVHEYYEKDQENLLAQSISQFQEFIRKYPDSEFIDLARYNLADIYAAQGDYEEALKYYIPLYDTGGSMIDSQDILRKISRIHVALGKWEEGERYFSDSLQMETDATERTTAAAYLLIARARSGQIGDAGQLLTFFRNPSPVFHTPRFNTALMEIGDKLYDDEEWATAGLFYQLVQSYENLEEGLQNYIRFLEGQITRMEGSVVHRDRLIEYQATLETTRMELEALQKSVNYTPLLSWRIARLYLEMKRHWEAYWRFRLLVDAYPDHPHSEMILYSAFSLAKDLEEAETARDLAERYFNNSEYREYRSTIANGLAELYYENRDWGNLFGLTANYLTVNPGDRVAGQLAFIHGMARLERYQTEVLIEEFEDFLVKYAAEPVALDLQYFLGLAYLIEEQYAEAVTYFDGVLARGQTPYTADAFFRKALATMGLEQIEEARRLLLQFIREHGSSRLRPEAEMALGQVMEMLGDFPAALQRYEGVGEFSQNVALLARAELNIVTILMMLGRSQEALDRMLAFVKAHGDSASSIPVSIKLADTYEGSGDLIGALQVRRAVLDHFLRDTTAKDIGIQIVEYIAKDDAARRMRNRTEAFWAELEADPELLRSLVQERAKQYRYFQENPDIDSWVQAKIVRDNEFRRKAFDSPNAVLELAAETRRMHAKLPELVAYDWLLEELAKSAGEGNVALTVRLEAALALSEKPPEGPTEAMLALTENPELWAEIGPTGQLWILRGLAEQSPESAQILVEEYLIEHGGSEWEPEAHLLLAAIYEGQGEKAKAADHHRIVSRRFSDHDLAGRSSIEVGRLMLEQERYEDARSAFEAVLQRPAWRGALHAEALLMLGRAYAAEGLHAEAHGYFERIILGYPSFHKILALAYYEDLKALQAMNEPESVRTVYEAFRETPGMEGTEGAELIEKDFSL